ncbi:hypothetical protein pEaSNUABM8_00085 [Erwinia phage pEa_SNUABM_8]|nr:hypothetical protein pEaSNUABM8_00085 [Erwinia phage pEa_SNUABM_8]QVW54837.1 hypothetical protein pEaSNUABM4_00084 [Erwinia phage pEa_SNUABM_4]
MTIIHKRAIITIAVVVALACSYITLNKDYNKCLDNGNSVAQCTGRG